MQYTTNSGEAVPGLTGLSGTILVVSLILLVLGAAVGVIGVYVSRKQRNSGLMAGLLMDVMRVGFGAAVLGGVSASIVAGSTLYQVPKVEAEKVAPPTSTGECSASEQTGALGDNSEEVAQLTTWEAPRGASFENVRYWPDPSQGCETGTVDACRMVQITGSKPADGAMGNLTDVGFNEWGSPVGECSSGEPEEVEF